MSAHRPSSLFALLVCLGAGAAYAEDDPRTYGVHPDRLVFGMATVLSGPSASLGQEMLRGVQARFDEVNAAGGVHGRRLELVAVDDGYEPGRTAPLMRELITERHVFGVVGNVGTPTAVVAVPIANELGVPFFGAFTGAGLLRKSPPDRWVINYRASYGEETAEMVEGLVKEVGIPPDRIAFFTQNDAYGDAGYRGGLAALRKLGFEATSRLVHGRYPRNTTHVEDGLSRILEAREPPRAVIMVGAYKACARFIQLARREGLDALFVNVSFVGPEALARELGPRHDDGVIVTQVVPPLDADLPALEGYRAAMKDSTHSFGSLEGYVAARALVEGVQRAGRDLDRAGFVSAIEAIRDLDLGLGVRHSLSPSEHQFSHTVWPTIIRGGQYRALDWRTLRRATVAQR